MTLLNEDDIYVPTATFVNQLELIRLYRYRFWYSTKKMSQLMSQNSPLKIAKDIRDAFSVSREIQRRYGNR